MAWGRTNSQKQRGGTSAWNTAGETASIKNACAMYGITEEQVVAAGGIECQWRSCHGNSYAVVKLSDMAKLKNTLVDQEKEARKAKMIEEMGEEGYKNHLAQLKANKEKELAVSKLVPMLKEAMKASSNGVAESIDNILIGKTAAKTEWYLKPDEIEKLPSIQVGKMVKYKLSDVIAAQHNKTEYHSGRAGHISVRVKGSDREKLYARFLHDKWTAQCNAVNDDEVVEQVYSKVRGEIEKVVNAKKDALEQAQLALKSEEIRLSTFDELMKNMPSNGDKKRSAVASKAKGAAIIAKENIENDSKPAAKKQKGGGLAQSIEAAQP